jgi:hypothetical protein
VRRGEVYDARLDPTEGSEQAGSRPVIIVSRDSINAASPVILAVPCTTYRPDRRLYPSQVLLRVPDQAIVLLGPPGSGKSSLLRHYAMDRARVVLYSGDVGSRADAPLCFWLSLNDYKVPRQGESLPTPKDWLEEHWATTNPDLPSLTTLLQQQRLTLLLDAFNEIPHSGSEAVRLWKEFLQMLDRTYPGNRVVFSCRSLDYSASLSSRELTVPQVRIESLSGRRCCTACCERSDRQVRRGMRFRHWPPITVYGPRQRDKNGAGESRPHRAVDRLQHFARRYRYVLRMDIVKHFPSIDHAILRHLLAQVIPEDDLLWLVDKILATSTLLITSSNAICAVPPMCAMSMILPCSATASESCGTGSRRLLSG